MLNTLYDKQHNIKQLADEISSYVNSEAKALFSKINALNEKMEIEDDIETTKMENVRIQLNVGGKLFSISSDCLMKNDSLFKYILNHLHSHSSKVFSIEGDGLRRKKTRSSFDSVIFIDRDPLCFDKICDYLRGEQVDVTTNKNVLLEEAKFYHIKSLVDLIKLNHKPTNKSNDVKNNDKEKNDSFPTKLTSFEKQVKEANDLLKEMSQNVVDVEEIENKISRYCKQPIVQVDVGGTIFTTSLLTLSHLPKDCLQHLHDNMYFIDRSPEGFENVLRQLREQKVHHLSIESHNKFSKDCQFYNIDSENTNMSVDMPYMTSNVKCEIKNDGHVQYETLGDQSRFQKNVKSSKMFDRETPHYLSIRFDKVSDKNVMVGCFDSNELLESVDLYNTKGGWFYLLSGSEQPTTQPLAQRWKSVSNRSIEFKENDIVTLKLDIGRQTLEYFHNNNPLPFISKEVPDSSEYYFMISAYSPNVKFTIVDVPVFIGQKKLRSKKKKKS